MSRSAKGAPEVPIHRTEAIVLRCMDYSETSAIVWSFTREHGRVHVIAKGARRPRSIFEGALEPLVRGELLFYRKKRAQGLDIAKEFDPIDRHMGLRRELGRLYRGAYLGELLGELSEADAPAEDAFAAASQGLGELARGPANRLDAALFRAELKLIRSAGLAPALEACTVCGLSGEEAGAPATPWFSVPAGGLLCDAHAGRDTAARRVAPGALKTLRALDAGQELGIGRDVARQVRSLLDAFLSHHLGKELRLARRLRGLMATGTRSPRAAERRQPQSRPARRPAPAGRPHD